MACPCCATADVCLCRDARTINCTFTIGLSIPEKNYTVSLPMSCSASPSNVFGYGVVRQPTNAILPTLDQGVQWLGNVNNLFGQSASVYGAIRAFLKDCPQPLSASSDYPYNVGFTSQGCDTVADTGSLPTAAFHVIVELHNRNSVLVGDANRYHYLYRIAVDANTNAVTASVVWQGQTGLATQVCFPTVTTLRCLPCYVNKDSFCGTNEGWVGSGHCPYDITTATPTLTIACPP